MEREKIDDHMGYEKVDDDDDLEYVKVEKVDADLENVKVEMVDDDMEYEKVEKAEMLDDDLENEMVEKAEMLDDDLENQEAEKVDDDLGNEKVDKDMEYEKEDVDCFTPSHPHPKRSKDMEIKEIVKDIVLPFLPAKALVRFKSVSKGWDRWIRNPFLAHQQSYYFKDLSGFFCQYAEADHTFVTLDNSAYGVPTPYLSFLPEEVNLLSSCNGLLLCHGCDALDPYYVCNPATREWTDLPPPELYHGTDSAAVLAFEPSALNMGAHYQLLCLIPMFDHVFVELYSSETNSWKISETTLVEMEYSTITGNGFYMKGIAYLETSTRKVIAFHLSTELYEVISLPIWTPPDGVLTQIQGELCYMGISCGSKNEYSIRIFTGMDLSFKRQLDVTIGPELESFPCYRVLPCLDGHNVMILIGSDIYAYSMSDRSVKMVASIGIASAASAKYLPYVNSLVQVAKPSDPWI